ncbi:hypothetical protein FGSG_08925 [Fusarium graminearum PH-1]|uniref:Chromosome 2, complete genome n=2 Tax=Gibberella zeae TaxID=5518 RepID=I1RX75_GIBZE|nr:hypothetical protein FGSG_08925 [Fusarium graminearum PH-1]CAF3432964.1 unnamed protein product [Fusarium graminearum]ESU14346.1 hypothetical protein FGSG_08925 [Fusarium graminearum PH-1]CAF3642018.1 unnamed protein product [Fusarium graminearum]CAF3665505.1 unnamed protein product [Fusarium graminearum]CAG2011111.1 unnamed protein product [Fusarium graminearum]|eukprot:XP_011319771.1 hypothetical protein FGSG_08925 [Fusarium graminearum PH-1]
MLSTTELLVSRPPITLSYSVPPSRSCFSFKSPNSSICMDTSTRTLPSPSLSLNCLSSELIALIFEQLRDLDSHALTSVRLVSKRLDAIAAPIAYRFLTLNEALVAPDAARRHPDVFRHISNLTNHVIIPSNLNSTGINSLLSCIKRLKSVRWRYVDGDVPVTGLWLPSCLRRLHNCDPNSTQLHIENLPLRREYENNLLETFIRSIPAELLTSLKLANSTPVLSTRLNSLKQLVVQARQLATLCYEDRGQGTCFNFSPGEKLSPINNLLLRSYDWQHTAEDVAEHWDFSGIQSLELISVPIFNFLKSVCLQDFSELHTLHAEDYSAHLSDKREDATVALNVLIKDHIKALEVLNITCHTQLFQLDAIAAHRNSLRVLRFRDHVGFSEDDQRCPTLPPSGLAGLGQQLKFVHTLELDLDTRLCDPFTFLRAVCAFPAVHTLTLHVQTMIQPLDEVAPGIDRDYEAAMKTFQLLVQEKQRLGVCTPWKHIAVNVGGWKRVMIRRLGGIWRRRNNMGIYAERCFVLERDTQSGKIAVHEEVCAEPTSHGGSPSP